MLTNQSLISGDWSRGPAGTGEFEFCKAMYGSWDSCSGVLAESWEVTEPGTIIFHIRKGIKYALDPSSAASRLVGGRELNAYDVATSLELLKSVFGSAPSFGGFRESKNTALDDWTVQTVLPPNLLDEIRITAIYCPLFAPELYEKKYDLQDCHNTVGTGPFMLKDFVSSSSATLVKNPTYWETDPVGTGKGSQLPYVASVRFLIIADDSTRLSAFRTGKIDVLHGVSWEDELVLKSNTKLLEKRHFSDALHTLAMRTDKQDLPFKDINVRKAMMLATDFNTIAETWGGGDAQILTYPIHYTKEDAPAYIGLDDPDLPQEVKDLYVYNPDKAKELLADAGYPEGFKTSIITDSTPGSVDYLSIIKDQWSKVGIEVTIEPKESGTLQSIKADRKHPEMIDQGGAPNANLFLASAFMGATRGGNMSYINDPLVNEAYTAWNAYTISDPVKAMGMFREVMKYSLGQAWMIPGVNPATYHMWWPWLKNYHGELGLARTIRGFAKYAWIDEELKDSMGY
jgi:peptide/nickel transport system substrate-binding protein